MLQTIHHSLDSMGVPQYLLAFLFLATYSLSIGGFVGERGRRYAVAAAATAAIAFAALTDPWEHGVLVVVLTLVALGVFAGGAWTLWALFGWPHAEHAWPLTEHEAALVAPAPPRDWSGPRIVTAVVALRRPARLLLRTGRQA